MAYESSQQKMDFPFWAKLWPSAFALTEFMQENPHWIKNRKVLELAAGLGLPSLFASGLAATVICSDYNQEAVECIKDNILLNGIENMEALIINWEQIPEHLDWDLLIMSDVNYNPADFEILLKCMTEFLERGKTILLSTPQRLAGRSFIEQLLPYCVVNEERWHDQVAVNVMVLKS